MFLLKVVQRFSPCRFSQPLSNFHILSAGDRTAACAVGIKGPPFKTPEPCCHAVRRSFLSRTSKIQNSPVQSLFLSRSFSTSPSTLSEEGRLIYTGNLGKAVVGVKMFSYTSSGASLLLMPQILLKTGIGVDSLALQVVFCGIIGFFTFVTPLLLHFVTRNYVVRLYHNEATDTYTAVTVSVFLTEKKTTFHQKQVKIPAVGGMFTSFYAGKMGLLVNPMLFPLPHDYNHLMGYDQPFTFDTDNID